MLYKLKKVINPYINPSFKFYFIEKWNAVCDKGIKNKEVPLGIVLAEAIAIMLDLMNEDQNANDKVEQSTMLQMP